MSGVEQHIFWRVMDLQPRSLRRRRRWDVASALVLFLTVLCSQLHAEQRRGKLTWKNGEALQGQLVEAQDGVLTWHADVFDQPAEIRTSVLQSVDFMGVGSRTQEPFRALMRDGSVLYGDLRSISTDALTLQSTRHGDVTLRRDQLLELRRIHGGNILYAGPFGVLGWTADRSSDDGYATLLPARGAALRIARWDRGGSLSLKMPERVEVRLRMHFPVRPEFSLVLASLPQDKLTIETWDDELVVHKGHHFTRIAQYTDADREVDLRIFWDRKGEACTVWSAAGKQLAQWKASGEANENDESNVEARRPVRGAVAREGLTLLNKSPELFLDFLEVRNWDGESKPSEIDPSKPSVELGDGHTEVAQVDTEDDGRLVVHKAAGNETAVINLEDVEAVRFDSSAVSPHAALGACEIWFGDGAFLTGSLDSIKDNVCRVASPISDQLVTAQLEGVRRLNFPGWDRVPGSGWMWQGRKPDTSTADLDVLNLGATVVHGKVRYDGGSQPRWQLQGGLNILSLIADSRFSLTRSLPEHDPNPKPEGLVYLSQGDVIPGSLDAMDRQEIRIKSEISDTFVIPTNGVHAIQFPGHGVVSKGFVDPGWCVVHGPDTSVTREGDTVELKAGGAFGHPSMLQGNDITFSLPPAEGGYGTLRLRMFCKGVDATSNSTNLLFGHFGDQFTCGLEREPNQLAWRGEVATSYESTVVVRLLLHDKDLECYVNGAFLQKIPLKSDEKQGAGLIFEAAGMWGNAVLPIKISGFAIKTSPGHCWAPVVSTEAKDKALTIPRFHKEDPPRNGLLAANGDLLRGSIDAATSGFFLVHSGMETLKVPRDRVAALVWLTMPEGFTKKVAIQEEAAPTPEFKATHWVVLASGAQFALQAEKFDDEGLIGLHPVLGRCHIPVAQLYELRNYAIHASAASRMFDDWKLHFAPEPVLPEGGGETSPLVGKTAHSFTLPLLDGQTFRLSGQKGKVVVLDFWATWCGPCVKWMPELMETINGFSSDQVRLIGVDQGEAGPEVQKFLDANGWKLTTVLDSDQKVSEQYQVEGIPHTVIIGPDGKVAWVRSGYTQGEAQEVAEVIRKLLKS